MLEKDRRTASHRKTSNGRSVYQLSKGELFRAAVEGLAFNALVSVLFYDSLFAMIPGMVILLFYIKEKKHMLMRKRKKRMQSELQEFFNALIAALQTGRSMENAFLEALRDLQSYTGKDTELVMEIRQICKGVSFGESLEKLLKEFAVRSCLEELEYFSEVFQVGKRSGGNLVGIMKHTIRMLQEKMEAEAEIYTVLSEKRLEFSLMSVIPLGILVYLRIGAGNLIESLYHNVTGILVMTGCVTVYGGCYLYGKRLLEIET